MHITFSKLEVPNSGTIVVGVGEDLVFTGKAAELDKKTKGALSKAIKSASFKGEKGKAVSIWSPAGTECDLIIVYGQGKEELTELNYQELGGVIFAYLKDAKVHEASVIIEPQAKSKVKAADCGAYIAYGAKLRSYRFDKYLTKEKKEDMLQLVDLKILCDHESQAKEFYEDTLKKVANGVFFARDVVTEPPNVLYPESYANRCVEKLEELGVEVKVLGVKEMDQLGMGALLGVGQGSIRESKLVVMRWNGNPKGKDEQPVAFVGKGVTFDTGGISLKPAAGMEDMKYDMGGSAAVVGLMKALAGRKAKVNAVGVVGLVENMPGGNAQRPSDVVHTMSGQTVEVLNTDAEGRLVLCDALWYTQDKFRPKFMINLATLTGAIVIALGVEYAGIFSNNDKLVEEITAAGKKTGERVWRFPLGEEYNKLLKSEIADMQNISLEKGAGSITAAQFLQRFVNDTPWAHLDIAGTAWAKKDKELCPKGATAFGVRLLDALVAEHYEK